MAPIVAKTIFLRVKSNYKHAKLNKNVFFR